MLGFKLFLVTVILLRSKEPKLWLLVNGEYWLLCGCFVALFTITVFIVPLPLTRLSNLCQGTCPVENDQNVQVCDTVLSWFGLRKS